MIEIRTARPDDWELVRDVRLRALTDAPDCFGARLAEARELPEQVWRERLEGPSTTLVAIEDGRGVAMGGLFLTPDPTGAMVWGMWTDPAHRGRGVGRDLLDALLDAAAGTGRTAYLHVTEGNDAARRLYVARGFAPTGVWEPLRDGSPLRVEKLVLRAT